MIIPALLVSNKEELREQLHAVRDHVSLVQLDVMDSTLTPRASFWDPQELEHVKTSVHMELHLMVSQPLAILSHFSALPNVRRVYVHVECDDDLQEVIRQARYYGFEIGLVLNPETSIDRVGEYVGEIDGVMFMGVNPGASGQQLISEVIEKIADFHETYPGIEIEIDGGVTKSTLQSLVDAGVTRFAVGSAIFGSDDPVKAIEELNALIQK